MYKREPTGFKLMENNISIGKNIVKVFQKLLGKTNQVERLEFGLCLQEFFKAM